MQNAYPAGPDAGLPLTALRLPTERRVLSEPVAAQRQAAFLRQCAWEIGARRTLGTFSYPASYVSLAMVHPTRGFVAWQLDPGWLEQTARERGEAWNGSRLIVRVYDVSYLDFNGLNAHSMLDLGVGHPSGEEFFTLPGPGTSRIAEAGVLLRSGEFVPAARSPTLQFARGCLSDARAVAALYVDDKLCPEPVASPWEGEAFVRERKRPKLRHPLRIAAFSFEAAACGHQGEPAAFVSGLTRGLAEAGHQVHLFVPASDSLPDTCLIEGVHHHPLAIARDGDWPVGAAWDFARTSDAVLGGQDFDLFYVNEWMSGLMPWLGTRPTMMSLRSTEAQRRGDADPSERSVEIEKLEREVSHMAECILVPDSLRDSAVADLAVRAERVHPFPLRGRACTEWDCPLDPGKVKEHIGFGPLDRLLLFVGPLEHGAGPDLLIEALPVALSRAHPARVAFVGQGGLRGGLEHRAHELGVAHAVRWLGDVPHDALVRLLRSSEALLLPSRHRVAADERVVDLARYAGVAVVTTHGGPAHRVRHESDGIVTFDNPGSIVWALDRILGDADNTRRLGVDGRQSPDGAPAWTRVVERFEELCARTFRELCQEPR